MSRITELRSKVVRRIGGKSAWSKLASDKFESLRIFNGRDFIDYFEQVDTCYKLHTNPFKYYEDIIVGLLKIANLNILPMYELFAQESDVKRNVGLRHDIDADPITALKCARFLARKGVCGSFYLLHTSPYYGEFIGEYFIRNPQLKEWVKEFIVSGCELGVHNDCLSVYITYGKDGAEALTNEIYWLRDNGAVIRGTVAHNSGPIYGAENYEIFRGRKLWSRKIKLKDGRCLPIGLISERGLGLTYEGTFARPKLNLKINEADKFFSDRSAVNVRSDVWMKRYLVDNPSCDQGVDFQFWLLGNNIWVAAGKYEEDSLFEWEIGLDRVLEIIRCLPTGSHSVLVLHPEYVRGMK